jgi:hypothetical protein
MKKAEEEILKELRLFSLSLGGGASMKRKTEGKTEEENKEDEFDKVFAKENQGQLKE